MDRRNITSHYDELSYDELSAQELSLVQLATECTGRSYAPYSHFAVGAALLLADGTVIPGCNQENAAFPAGICAERSALFAAGAAHPDTPPVAMAIAARHLPETAAMPQTRQPACLLQQQLLEEPVTPCGTCRQVIVETEKRYRRHIRLLLVGRGKIYAIDSIRQLMPLTFTEF
ncbi:MAG: cytidine deaminase [Prevotella sp.]|nr:cytidine deaminase [Prevotella sp.]